MGEPKDHNEDPSGHIEGGADNTEPAEGLQESIQMPAEDGPAHPVLLDADPEPQQPEQQHELEEEDNYEDIDHELTPEPDHSSSLLSSQAAPVTAADSVVAPALAAPADPVVSDGHSTGAPEQMAKPFYNEPGDGTPQVATPPEAAAEVHAKEAPPQSPAAAAPKGPTPEVAVPQAGVTKVPAPPAAEAHAPSAAPVAQTKSVTQAAKQAHAGHVEETHPEGSSSPLQDEASMEATSTTKPHKETAFERLTMPTSMRLLKMLEQTQAGKNDFHIATGVTYQSKTLTPEEMSAMVERLCTVKTDEHKPGKLHAVKLVYENNKETYVPVKEATKEENIEYMSNLYARCKETREKTHVELAQKYLQPLGKPRKAA